MAIKILEQNKKQQYLVFILVVLIIAIIIVVWQGFLRGGAKKAAEEERFIPAKSKIKLSLEILQDPVLDKLEATQAIPAFEKKDLGRKNPFTPF
ncbi:MAG: hypothetical protein HYW70_00390 [Candidatus Nealsonbacteria bacterium]|nr:hypothetical protein [Candidatus Nealsonbacteria bacterium]